MEGRVLEPVPAEHRNIYTYWRAAHLGNIALNFIKGEEHLNAWGVNYAHFTDKYAVAETIAKNLAQPNSTRLSQFGEEHRQEFYDLTGIPPDFGYPSIVYALDPALKNSITLENRSGYDPFGDDFMSLAEFTKPMSFGGGHLLYGRLTLDKIDTCSRYAIEELFADS